MKNFRKIVALLVALLMLVSFAACGKNGESGQTETEESTEREYKTKISVLNGPTGLSLSKLKTDRSYAYDVEYYNDPQEIVPLLVNGETDIAALPLNLAANLYKKTQGGIQILAINTLGVLHVLEKGDTVKSIEDLKGKTVYSTGQGATPEFIVNYILSKNSIDYTKDLTIEYKSNHSELATLAVEGSVDICILPEPFATKVLTQNKDFREALDLTAEWSKVNEKTLAQGCIVARKDYIENHRDLLEEFFTLAEVSVNFVNTNINAGLYLYENGFFDREEIAEATIPGCNMVFITGEEMKAIAMENFNVLFEADPASVGGEMPDDSICYIAQ